MSNLNQILKAAESGDQRAAKELLPLVYSELRRLAKARLSHEQPGQTLQATDLVHEAYHRLIHVENGSDAKWNGTGHFFGAAAEALDSKWARQVGARAERIAELLRQD